MNGQAAALSYAYGTISYTDDQDLRSLRRWLYRNLPRNLADTEPNIYIEPLEMEFVRPAVTVRLLRTLPVDSGSAARPAYDVEHPIVMTVYGKTRAETLSLGEQVIRLIHEGGDEGNPYRIPLWEFTDGETRRSRMMRVRRSSVTMGLEASDEDGRWSRPIEMLVQAPRARRVPHVPVIERVVTTGP